jgi:hypothetical protein
MPFLRRVLVFDSVTCVMAAILILSVTATVEPLLAIPSTVFRRAAVVVLLFGAVVGYVATRDRLSGRAVRAIIALNALWVVASVMTLAFGWLTPNTPVAVAVLAGLQAVALQRGARAGDLKDRPPGEALGN